MPANLWEPGAERLVRQRLERRGTQRGQSGGRRAEVGAAKASGRQEGGMAWRRTNGRGGGRVEVLKWGGKRLGFQMVRNFNGPVEPSS